MMSRESQWRRSCFNDLVLRMHTKNSSFVFYHLLRIFEFALDLVCNLELLETDTLFYLSMKYELDLISDINLNTNSLNEF